MTQALPVQVSSSQAFPTASSGANSAENTDSGASFAQALAGQLAGDDAPEPSQGAAPEPTATTASDSSSADSGQAEAAMLATPGGKALPPGVATAPGTDATTTAVDASSALRVPQLPTLAASADRAANDSAGMSAKETTEDPATDDTDNAALAALAGLLGQQAGTPVAVRGQPVVAETQPAAPAPQSGLPGGVALSPEIERSIVDATAMPVSEKVADAAIAPDAFKTVLASPGAHTPTDSTPSAASLAAFDRLSAAIGTNNVALTPLTSTTGQISIPISHNGWGQAFSNQVVWTVNHGASSAELHLSPPELGPVSVRLSLDHDQASIAFTSPHAVVRDAIEAAMPRLRDMLGAQGITLADVNVSQQQSNAQRESGGGWGPAWSPSGGGSGETGADASAPAHLTRAGVLDVFV